MSEPSPAPLPYRVVYSELVRSALLNLGAKAKKRGLGRVVIEAIKEIDRRLHIYPQFGEPLRDLKLVPAVLYIGVVPPLTIKYTLDEERHLVMVSTPVLPLSGTGLDD